MNNKLHVYTGDGKGKTTAAMGLALRSLGHGNRVLVAQFMKSGNSGELKAFRRFPEAVVMTAPPIAGFTFRMTEEQKRQTAQDQTAFAEEVAARAVQEQPRTVILDELCAALYSGMVARETAEALLGEALRWGETVVTGRDAPDWLLARADYVSRVQAEKHPFVTEGLPARKGVEW